MHPQASHTMPLTMVKLFAIIVKGAAARVAWDGLMRRDWSSG